MLTIRPSDLKSANEFIKKYHRHNGIVQMARFSIAAYDGDRLCGVAICGNPVARKLDTGLVLEVRRCCTDGTKNACSLLYGRCARIAKEMGFDKIITYICQSETGATMRASGWEIEAENTGNAKGWDMPSRPRIVDEIDLFGRRQASYPLEKKVRYCKILNNGKSKDI